MSPRKAIVVAAFLWIGSAHSGILDDTGDLKGKVVVAAGDVEQLSCPIYGDYDCASWPRNLLQFRYDNVCIVSDITACAGIGCTGLLAVGKDEVLYFFSIERLGSGLKKHSAKVIECPSMY